MILFGAVVVLHIFFLIIGWNRSSAASKTLLIPTLILSVTAGKISGGTIAPLVVVGLVFGWLGDIALLGKGSRPFIIGLTLFLLGHIAYIYWFGAHVSSPFIVRMWWILPPAIAILIGAGLLLWRRAGPLRIPAIVYSVVLTFSLVVAVTALRSGWDRGVPAATGAALFLVSDAILGLREFTPWIGRAQVAVMATYIPAQLCIALSGVG